MAGDSVGEIWGVPPTVRGTTSVPSVPSTSYPTTSTGGGKQQRSSEPRKGYETVEKATSEPWGPTQGYLEQILGQSASNFNNGVGTAWPDFPTVLGMGQGTQSAIGNYRDMYANPSALSTQAQNTVQSMLTPDARYGEVYDRAMAPSASETYLSDMAAGPTQNPYLQQLLDSGSNRIANEVKAAYSNKGRYGSNDFTDALARGISEYQTPIQYAAYDADRNRQLSAAGMIDDARLAGGSLGLSAVGAGNAQQLSAAGLANSFDQNKLSLADRLLQAGMLEDQYAQAQRDAQTEKFLWENGGAQQAALTNYLNAVGGIAGLGGSQTVQEPRKPFQKALGTALSVAGTVAPFFV